MLGPFPTDPLTAWLAQHGQLPLDQVEQALTNIIAAGGGSLTCPTFGVGPLTYGKASPCTGDWEIECLGVYARGHDAQEATRNWLKAARAIAYPEVAA